MRKKNRSYKKGEPHRDARLFIIVAEGEREDEYFRFFHMKNQRIKIEIVPREQGNSSPNDFIPRLKRHFKAKGYSEKDEDQVWFVLDVDRWKRDTINNIHDACLKERNWDICISNPCFEVWLHLHFVESVSNDQSCRQLKQSLAVISKKSNIHEIAEHIDQAIKHAKSLDRSPYSFFPEKGKSKLYKLGEKLNSLL